MFKEEIQNVIASEWVNFCLVSMRKYKTKTIWNNYFYQCTQNEQQKWYR